MKSKFLYIAIALFSLSAVSSEKNVKLSEINSTIYESLIDLGYDDDTVFKVEYKTLDGSFNLNKNGNLVASFSSNTPSIPSAPKIGDTHSYSTNIEEDNKLYKMEYVYTYMMVDDHPEWVLISEIKTFIGLKPKPGGGQIE